MILSLEMQLLKIVIYYKSIYNYSCVRKKNILDVV